MGRIHQGRYDESVPALTKDHEENKIQYAVFKIYEKKLFWKISNMVPTPRNPQYAASNTLDTLMDDPNITMEEYIRLKEEKAQKHRKLLSMVGSDFSTEPTLYPQHIDKFHLNDETSLFKYDEVEQSVLYFNDLFPFNIVYLDDQKLDKGDDENGIDMIQSSGGSSHVVSLGGVRHLKREEAGAMISGGHYVARLAEHFGLLTKERLQGLMAIAYVLPIIDMAELEDPVAPRGGDEDEVIPQVVPPPPRTQ
nr:hypothetical protein [Tanacetum cinerariifolium]